MMIRLFQIFCAICMFAPMAVAESPVLVELFSSKNCQNCPKAHRTLSKMADDGGDVLIITWSVDYWDYLGGKDPMAMSESKDRQRGYVERFGLRGPYTPQTVYNGVEQCPGNRPSQVDAALERLDPPTGPGASVQILDDKLVIDGAGQGLSDIWLVHFLAGEDNPTDMVHPVTRVDDLGPWLGGRRELDLPDCLSGCVVIVQEAGFGPVWATLPIAP